MTNKEWIELFFSEAYEKQINELMLEDRDYEIPYNTIHNYVKQLIEIPYTEFLDYIRRYKNVSYKKIDIPQYVKFIHCENAMIRLLINNDNMGCEPLEVGQLLSGYFTKSSRNHIKYANRHLFSAKILGIVFEYFGHWYLNCLGYIYINLTTNQKNALLARTLLRSPFFKSIFANNPRKIVLSDCLELLPYNFVKTNYIAITKLIEICITEAQKSGRIIYFLDHLTERKLIGNILNSDSLKKKSSSLSYSIYVNELMRGYYIHEKEALRLFYRYKNGDKYALEEIIKAAQPIVIKIASSFHFAPIEDIIQEGNIGLLLGIDNYDPQRNASFYGVLSFWVKRCIQSSQSDISSLVHIPANVIIEHNAVREFVDRYIIINETIPSINDIEIGEEMGAEKKELIYNLPDNLSDIVCLVDDIDCFESNSNSIEEFEENDYYNTLANYYLNCVDERSKLILRAFYGFDSMSKTLDSIGDTLKLSRERVRQIKTRTIKLLHEIYVETLKNNNIEYIDKIKKELKTTGEDILPIHIQKTIERIEQEKQKLSLIEMDAINYLLAKEKALIGDERMRYLSVNNPYHSHNNLNEEKEEKKEKEKNEKKNSMCLASQIAKVGDRILYGGKKCIVLEKLKRGQQSRLIVQYDDNTIDNVKNDIELYKVYVLSGK